MVFVALILEIPSILLASLESGTTTSTSYLCDRRTAIAQELVDCIHEHSHELHPDLMLAVHAVNDLQEAHPQTQSTALLGAVHRYVAWVLLPCN